MSKRDASLIPTLLAKIEADRSSLLAKIDSDHSNRAPSSSATSSTSYRRETTTTPDGGIRTITTTTTTISSGSSLGTNTGAGSTRALPYPIRAQPTTVTSSAQSKVTYISANGTIAGVGLGTTTGGPRGGSGSGNSNTTPVLRLRPESINPTGARGRGGNPNSIPVSLIPGIDNEKGPYYKHNHNSSSAGAIGIGRGIPPRGSSYNHSRSSNTGCGGPGSGGAADPKGSRLSDSERVEVGDYESNSMAPKTDKEKLAQARKEEKFKEEQEKAAERLAKARARVEAKSKGIQAGIAKTSASITNKMLSKGALAGGSDGKGCGSGAVANNGGGGGGGGGSELGDENDENAGTRGADDAVNSDSYDDCGGTSAGEGSCANGEGDAAECKAKGKSKNGKGVKGEKPKTKNTATHIEKHITLSPDLEETLAGDLTKDDFKVPQNITPTDFRALLRELKSLRVYRTWTESEHDECDRVRKKHIAESRTYKKRAETANNELAVIESDLKEARTKLSNSETALAEKLVDINILKELNMQLQNQLAEKQSQSSSGTLHGSTVYAQSVVDQLNRRITEAERKANGYHQQLHALRMNTERNRETNLEHMLYKLYYDARTQKEAHEITMTELQDEVQNYVDTLEVKEELIKTMTKDVARLSNAQQESIRDDHYLENKFSQLFHGILNWVQRFMVGQHLLPALTAPDEGLYKVFLGVMAEDVFKYYNYKRKEPLRLVQAVVTRFIIDFSLDERLYGIVEWYGTALDTLGESENASQEDLNRWRILTTTLLTHSPPFLASLDELISSSASSLLTTLAPLLNPSKAAKSRHTQLKALYKQATELALECQREPSSFKAVYPKFGEPFDIHRMRDVESESVGVQVGGEDGGKAGGGPEFAAALGVTPCVVRYVKRGNEEEEDEGVLILRSAVLKMINTY